MSAKKAASGLLKLYAWKKCPYCQRAEIAAIERGVPYERVEVPQEMPDWYKKINPSETIPTLEIEEGKYRFESMLIAQYFDNVVSPTGALMGSTPYQRHRIEFFVSQVGDLVGACSELLQDPLNTEKRQAVHDNVKYIDGILAETQVSGGPYLLDNQFSMGDIAIVPFLVRYPPTLAYYSGIDFFANGPHLKTLWAAARQRPSVAKTSMPPSGYIAAHRKYLPADSYILKAEGGPVLYASSICPYADRARLACAAKGFKPYYVEISLTNMPDWYKNINFRETVPTLVTEDGEYIHESQPIVQYVDHVVEGGMQLVPRGDAEKEYSVGYLVTMAGHFANAYYGLSANPTSADARAEMVWCITQLEKILAEKPFGPGPFHGGQNWDAGDIALMPFVMRVKANTPELTGGFDAFAAYPFLEAYLKAGRESPVSQGIFLAPEEYLAFYKERIARQKAQEGAVQ